MPEADRSHSAEQAFADALHRAVRKGFGSRLMDNLARQVGGAVAHDWRPEGLRCNATVDARHVGPQAMARQAA